MILVECGYMEGGKKKVRRIGIRMWECGRRRRKKLRSWEGEKVRRTAVGGKEGWCRG